MIADWLQYHWIIKKLTGYSVWELFLFFALLLSIVTFNVLLELWPYARHFCQIIFGYPVHIEWSSFGVDLISFKSKRTDKREQYNWRAEKKFGRDIVIESFMADVDGSRPSFFLWSSWTRVDLLSYESKPTDKWEQCDWRAEKNLDRVVSFARFFFLFKDYGEWKAQMSWKKERRILMHV